MKLKDYYNIRKTLTGEDKILVKALPKRKFYIKTLKYGKVEVLEYDEETGAMIVKKDNRILRIFNGGR